jgi:hypothetical protein
LGIRIQVLPWNRYKDVGGIRIQVLSWNRYKDVGGIGFRSCLGTGKKMLEG